MPFAVPPVSSRVGRWTPCAGLVLVSLLVGCASGVAKPNPTRSVTAKAPPAKPVPRVAAAPRAVEPADGAPDEPGPEPHEIADAEPTIEPHYAGNSQPYRVGGRSYVPRSEDQAYPERGLASWYGRRFQGKRTASGERYDMNAMTAAHPTLPLPSYVRVRNPANGHEVIVRVNDRGPFHPGRIIDLSYVAARKLGVLRGLVVVEVERITHDDIRTGAWRRDTAPAAPAGAEEELRVARAGRLDDLPPGAPMLVPVSARMTLTAGGLVPSEPAAAPLSAASSAGPAPVDPAAPGHWVQLGAFRLRDGAEFFQRQVAGDVAWVAPKLSVLADAEVHRLQVGPFATRHEAQEVAQRLRQELHLVPVVMERR